MSSNLHSEEPTLTRTGYYWDERSLGHDTGESHVECIARAERLRPDRMSAKAPGLLPLPVEEKDAIRWLCRVHDRSHLDFVRGACAQGGGLLGDTDTIASGGSYAAALASINAGLSAADAIMSGQIDNAFSALRPPGHHALPDRIMGYCLFNNVAILARYLLEAHGLGRVAIVDFDVHHGNGTQDIFWRDPDVLFISLHQSPLYPDSGFTDERGEGPGEGMTLNVPIAPGTSEQDYLATLDTRVLPTLRAFAPEFLLVSAGFDAHRDDPLGELNLTEEGYAAITRSLRQIADEHCDGRLISLLEGGYDLDALACSVAAHVKCLMQ